MTSESRGVGVGALKAEIKVGWHSHRQHGFRLADSPELSDVKFDVLLRAAGDGLLHAADDAFHVDDRLRSRLPDEFDHLSERGGGGVRSGRKGGMRRKKCGVGWEEWDEE